MIDTRPIQIQLNGEVKKFEKPLTLAELLTQLSLVKEKVVVEHNLIIISREDLAKTTLKEGDTVEIVHFVGGGAEEEPKTKPKLKTKKVKKADGEAPAPAKKHSGPSALVIVESPAKCKTIHKYLGSNFEVTASMGHVIDLPKSKMGIDIEHDFQPRYIVMKDKKKVLADLKQKAKNKTEIYLACDPDREGEAISWHLMNELGKGKKVVRVVFNEITKEAVQEAFKHPSAINMDLVSAQQARRVLDRLVGYSLSPLLWQKVGRGLSAGRVQSVALRLIVDREREIQAFIPEEYWTIEAKLKKKNGNPQVFSAKLEKYNGEKIEIKDAKFSGEILAKAKKEGFVVTEIKEQKKKRNPSSPFTTSKLQQAAYNQLRFPASKTMRVAQTLYEGVELGSEGSVGLITYMRTDSVRLSDGALKETREFIEKEYGKKYLPDTPNIYKSKKQAQEAHEAIRPTSVLRRPQDVESYLAPDQFKLYSLIWAKTVSSQMTPALISQETAEIAAGPLGFRASGSRVEFLGCLIVEGRTEEDDHPLPKLEKNEKLDLVSVEEGQHFTKPPARYTDASLVKTLEEKGIGRPSTYAPTIATLTTRDYIRRDGGSLTPSELGMLITDLLVKHFEKVMGFEFTAGMEEELDEIEEGKKDWVKVIRNFYSNFGGQVELAKTGMETVKRENEPTDEICDKKNPGPDGVEVVCGKPMVIKWGRRGRFMSCSGWPDCKNAKSISTGVACPQCKEGKLVMRRAKSGKGRAFYGCTRYPDCNFLANKLPKEGEAPASSENTPPAGAE